MPRLNKVEMCLLCGETPCSCAAGAKKLKPPARAQKTRSAVGGEAHESVAASEPSPVQRPSMRDKMKAAAAVAPVRHTAKWTEPVLEPPPQLPPDPDPTLVLASALRALAPILHPDEIARYSTILGSAPSTPERAASWRARVQRDS